MPWPSRRISIRRRLQMDRHSDNAQEKGTALADELTCNRIVVVTGYCGPVTRASEHTGKVGKPASHSERKRKSVSE